MSHTDYRILINRGRKSGLKTSELYNALAGQPAPAGEFASGQTDSNGFMPAFDNQGHPLFKPRNGQNNR